MILFNNKDTVTEIEYVIAHFQKHTQKWYRYDGYKELEKAKRRLEQLRARNNNVQYGIFEQINCVTITQIDEAHI